jgi:penicillin-insensitive murein endopeptidase
MKRTLIIAFAIILYSTPIYAADIESTCYGTTSNGRLENGVALPDKGTNFRSYTALGGILGRTYVHSRVRDVIVNSFKALENLTGPTRTVFRLISWFPSSIQRTGPPPFRRTFSTNTKRPARILPN